MNQKIKTILKITLPLLLGVFLVWYSLQDVPLSVIIEHWHNADKWWILFGVFLGLLSHLSRAYRWRFQLEPMGYKVRFGNSVMAVFATYLINYTIPRAGEVARASILANYENVPFEKGIGTIVSERIADVLVVIGIIIVTLFMPQETKINPEFIPFENIGLCFSGGGYRATFFALGILSYLNQVSYKNKSFLK